MSTDFEQRLRAEMEQVTVRPRPGLVKQAYRDYRGKRRTTRAVAATGAAAIAAGTAVGVTAATSRTAITAQTTAYVVSHVSSALAATNRIAYTNTTFSVPENAAISVPENTRFGSASTVIDEWRYGIRYRTLSEAANGQPLSQAWVPAGHGKPTLISVDYQQRSWSLWPASIGTRIALGGTTDLCKNPSLAILAARYGAATDWKPMIESGLRCGLFHVAGHQRVEGIDAIKLTGTADTGIFTLWVDPHTYLPVQVAGDSGMAIVSMPIGKNGRPTKLTMWIHFRWLPPTRANLAQLTGTIPPGFRQVPPPSSQVPPPSQ